MVKIYHDRYFFNLSCGFTGVWMTRPYGPARSETAGELLMTLMIHGQGKDYLDS